jgi:alpha-1,2-mannosyltransferase
VLAGTVYTVCVRCGRAGGSLLLAQSLGWASLAVLVVEPVRSNLDYDQINTLLMGMVVVDLLVVPRRHRGWLVGLAAAIKLTPLIFLAIPLLERDWRSAGRSAGAAVGATGLAWLLCPAASWTYWSKDVFDARRVGDVAYAGNQSLYGDLHRWPFASGGHTAIWVVISAATLVMGAYVTKRCLLDNRRVAAVLSLAFVGLEVSPISWTHHWVWVALVPPVLVVGRRQVPGLATRTSLWVLSGVSVLAPYWWFGSGVAREWLGDSLSLCAFVMLALWSGSEYTNRADGARRTLPENGLQEASLPMANASNWNN